MQTKTYFASSVQAAMDLARQELGSDAMLVNSRPAPEAARAFGRLEVVFAWEPDGSTTAASDDRILPGPRVVKSASRDAETVSTRGSGLEDIRLEISALRAAIGGHGQPGFGKTPEAATPIEDHSVESLRESGFEKDLARQIVAAASQTDGSRNDAVQRELTSRIPVASFLPLQSEENRILAFVGAPGRGKTTSLVKIAVRHGLANRIPTRIYSAGAHAVGASEQLARYAAILGVPFQATESFDSLNLALDGDRWKGLVLIDTPGIGFHERSEMADMAKFFARRTNIEKHLVIRADARSADMQHMVAQFSPTKPSRLLFTGLDEARGLGAAAETMIRSGIAVEFLGTGPRIPDDLEEMNVPKLIRSIWTSNTRAAIAA